ncbi:hypothetical protein JXC34_01615 [Candidatus Woesearchaeota archaeon]|nr:hypothetical protein [Candidatus Woesearchaeota archaeon]
MALDDFPELMKFSDEDLLHMGEFVDLGKHVKAYHIRKIMRIMRTYRHIFHPSGPECDKTAEEMVMFVMPDGQDNKKRGERRSILFSTQSVEFYRSRLDEVGSRYELLYRLVFGENNSFS